jgi:glyoxylate reductase
MSAPRLKVVLTRRLPDAVETRMRELFDAELNLTDRPMDRAALEAAVQRADVLVPTITDTIDAALIAGAGEQLKMIANFGAGVDHIDIDAAVGRGLIVTNTPGVLTEDTADLTMALILAVSRRIVEGAQVVAEGRFEGWTPTWMTGRKLWGKRLGVRDADPLSQPQTRSGHDRRGTGGHLVG